MDLAKSFDIRKLYSILRQEFYEFTVSASENILNPNSVSEMEYLKDKEFAGFFQSLSSFSDDRYMLRTPQYLRANKI
jgi:hypothetical protein